MALKPFDGDFDPVSEGSIAEPRNLEPYEGDFTPIAQDKSLGSEKSSETSAIRSLGDTAIAAGTGIVRGAQLLANTAGAGNPISRGLGTAADYLQGLESGGRQAERAARTEKIKQAEQSGNTWDEVKAYAGAFGEAPIDTTVEALGTSLPTIVAAGLTRGKTRTLIGGGLGAAQGAGAVKGSIYDAVDQEYQDSGLTPEEAAQKADEAQAYTGKNAGQIALGAGVGAVAGTTGVESAVGRIFSKEAGEATAKGLVRSGLVGAAKEAPIEALQGGQEQYASNSALQNEGFDTPTWRGVAGSAVLEGLAGGAAGGGFGIAETGLARRRLNQEQSDTGLNEPQLAPISPSPADNSKAILNSDTPAPNQQQLEQSGTDTPAELQSDTQREVKPQEPIAESPPSVVPIVPELATEVTPEPLGLPVDEPEITKTLGDIQDVTPVPPTAKPSERMGLNPAAGPLSAAAAIAVDSGAAQIQPPAAEAPALQQKARIPIIITNKMRAQLKELGYQDTDIRKLRPQQAWDVINSAQPKAADAAPPTIGAQPIASASTDQSLTSPVIESAEAMPLETRTPQEPVSQPEPVLPEASVQDSGEVQWDNLSKDQRKAVLAGLGRWNTHKGTLNIIGNRLLSAKWSAINEDAKGVIRGAFSQSGATATPELRPETSTKPEANPVPAQPQPEELPSILTTPKSRYLADQAKQAGVKKGSTEYNQAIQELESNYEGEVAQSLSGLSFEQYQALNNGIPESVNRKAWESLRGESSPAAPEASQITQEANQAATSPANTLPEPSQAQKEAGNYKKGHVRINGLDISIENPAGSQRSPEWPALNNHYGYFKGTVGKDKDHVDVFLTDRASDPELPVFVVDQRNQDGSFDEHKVVMGTATEPEAREAYLSNYSDGWNGLEAITQMSQSEFKEWVRDPKKTKRPASPDAFKAPAVPVQESKPKNLKEGIARVREKAKKEADEQPKPTRDDTPKFSRYSEVGLSASSVVSGKPIENPITLEQAEAAAREWLADYHGNIPLDMRIRRTQYELYGPKGTAEHIGIVKGAYHSATASRRGIFTLASDNLSSVGDARETLRHEILGHYGLDTFRPEAKKALLEKILASKNEPSLSEIWADTARLYSDKSDIVQAEKVFARIAEVERSKALQIMDLLRSALIKLLKAVGFKKGVITRSELLREVEVISKGIRQGIRKANSDNQSPSFSRNSYRPEEPSVQGTKATYLRTLLPGLTKNWKNAPSIEIVQSIQELPSELRSFIEEAEAYDVEGLHSGDGNRVYLIADNLRSPQHAIFVLQHEVLGHAGLQGAFGDALIPLLLDIYRTNQNVRQLADEKTDQFGYNLFASVEEALADMAADGSIQQQGFWKRLVAAIRSLLRKSFPSMRWTDGDVQGLLANARRYIEKGARATSSGRPQYSRPTDSDLARQFNETAAAYGGENAWRVAKDAGQTKLTYPQWVQVRTPAFKAWFGEWENNYGPRRAGINRGGNTGPQGWRDTGRSIGDSSTTNTRVSGNPEPLRRSDSGVWGVRGRGGMDNTRGSDEADSGQAGAIAQRDWRIDPETGEPAVFYHGTRDEFTRFDLNHPNRKDLGWLGRGVYVASDRRLADWYAKNKKGTGKPEIMGLFVNVRNPVQGSLQTKQVLRDKTQGDIDKLTAYWRTNGHDGVILAFPDGTYELMAFDPTQVKSATDNTGRFDGANSDIRFSRASQARNLLNRALGPKPLDPTDPFAEENRRLREQDKGLWDKAKKVLVRQFAPGGLLPSKVFDEKIVRDSEFQAIEFDVRHLVGGLNQAVKEAYGKDTDALDAALMERLHESLAGKLDPSLAEPVKVQLVAMRQYIDALSKDYLSILQGQIDALKALDQQADSGLYDRIKANIGSYVNRSYRAFDDPKWFQSVPTEVLNTARQYLTNRYVEDGMGQAEAKANTERVMEEMLKTGTAYDSMSALISEGKLGAKDLSILIKRKDIAPEIRALLGEYKDPRINFAKSATKTGRLVWNQRFLDRVREIGMGTFLFEKNDPNRPPEAGKPIAGKQSDTYAPLNGLYTFPEVEQSFRDALGQEQMADWYRFIVRMNGYVKYGKTVLSPTTAARNWQSGMLFSIANGHFDLSQMKKGLIAFREQVSQKATGSDLEYLRKMKRLGVVYDAPYAAEMADLIKDARLDEFLSGKTGQGFKQWRKFNQLAQGFYSFGDDFWKIVGFENEKASLLKAGMTEAQAEQEAAKRIRNTYPTYSMVGRSINWLRRFPLAGTFVSFPSEIIRTSANMLRMTHQDLKSDNPNIRALGRKRLAGMAMVSAGFWALSALTAAMLGVGDDEEEALRDMAADWQKNSTFLYTGRDEDGRLRYIDLSFLDPYGYWKRPVTAMMRDQPWEKAAASGLSDLLTPFFGADIAAKAIFEVMANKKGTGGRIYNEDAGSVEQLQDIADHMRKALQPGFMSNAEGLVKASLGMRRESSGQPIEMRNELTALLGWRASTLDAKTGLLYRARDFDDALNSARWTLRKELTSVNPVSNDDIRSAKESAQKQYERAHTEMQRIVKAAEVAGVSRRDTAQILERSGLSKREIFLLLNGRVPPLRLSPESMQRSVKDARATLGVGHAQEVARRFRVANGI
ncbi:hypothetical protein LX59_03062 [Azomonas agilis]|uniref:Uncharacterized protein n=1 Tax=Azomonas agilis TaxID=116849 RepID=A0A562HYI5_9GAMM|nr:hypothetical protein [Azomonas agilis]TWH63811.1 hypothetical protein LX59_03062 [Azomonas agilis]